MIKMTKPKKMIRKNNKAKKIDENEMIKYENRPPGLCSIFFRK